MHGHRRADPPGGSRVRSLGDASRATASSRPDAPSSRVVMFLGHVDGSHRHPSSRRPEPAASGQARTECDARHDLSPGGPGDAPPITGAAYLLANLRPQDKPVEPGSQRLNLCLETPCPVKPKQRDILGGQPPLPDRFAAMVDSMVNQVCGTSGLGWFPRRSWFARRSGSRPSCAAVLTECSLRRIRATRGPLPLGTRRTASGHESRPVASPRTSHSR